MVRSGASIAGAAGLPSASCSTEVPVGRDMRWREGYRVPRSSSFPKGESVRCGIGFDGGAADVRAKALATSGRCSLLDRAGMVEARYRDIVEARVRTRRLFGLLQMGSFDQEQLGCSTNSWIAFRGTTVYP
jgi:hypothetical protein